jgi:hypothetical protein
LEEGWRKETKAEIEGSKVLHKYQKIKKQENEGK